MKTRGFLRWGAMMALVVAVAGALPARADAAPFDMSSGWVDFFIPLKVSTSGEYPSSGTASDSVYLSSSHPTSSGFLDMTLDFPSVPAGATSATLYLDLIDLDLKGDLNQAGSAKATLFETLTVIDSLGRQLAYLDQTSGPDDNFTWTVPLVPDEHSTLPSSYALDLHFTATTTLIAGSSIGLRNTVESVRARIVGETGGGVTPIPEPAAVALILGGAGLMAASRRKNRKVKKGAKK